MIYVAQGHEQAIGIEVFLKSFSLLNSVQQKNFSFIAFKETLVTHLNELKIHYKFENGFLFFNGNKLKVIEPDQLNVPESSASLITILRLICSEDILLTLPTSKDQLILNEKMCKGYTEFLRKKFQESNLCMVFKAFESSTLLISDHIPLKDVPKFITKEIIVKKCQMTLENFKKYFYPLEEIIFSGINPHCGEGGLLGHEDQVIDEAIIELKKEFKINFLGPVSGDTLHFHNNNLKKQLKVYMFHDQGLPVFKDKFKTIGLNITLGLPFLRMSVDHGTAFDLYGKDKADYSGCYYMLKESIKIHDVRN
ncbi:hypothetical protein A9Q84_20875 [Halobacteriovorax marinus]|uniref:4-hydroxythreonine-4-phosphate dehydrogenase n=1 Tax=Halobacteriovorax marinus TaxID=97084 RepID=A0A1Y5F1R7_9BACT|nr:hypothetical protein A9Q84_20875 [Halobacteriovorax marinus]